MPAQTPAPPSSPPPADPPSADANDDAPLELEHVQSLWKQAVIPAVTERSIPTASVLNEARPVELAGERLVIEFPPAASFHRNLAEDPKNAQLLEDVLYQVTGRRLSVAFAVGEAPEGDEEHDEGPPDEEEFVSLFKSTFDAREVDE